ncbi:MAG: cobalamin B12-binding domain-containing protein, partial [Nitrososphaera sp.]|nr:cobalamin B12-binding domain-containing protein [Nitrososphaera sp.]
MKILFVLPYEELSGIFYTEPLGIMYLSAVARQAGHACSATLANWPDFSEALKRLSPDVIAFSAT